MEEVLEILKYTLPAIIVLIATAAIVKNFLNTESKIRRIELMRDTQDITVRLRLQAYERLSVFVERSHPRNIIPRVYVSGMTVADLQQALVFNIKGEFEHNLSQQIYVSKHVWNAVRNVREQEISMISQIAKQLPPDAPAKELQTRIIDYVVTAEGEMPSEMALQLINEEAKQVLSYGTLS